MADRWLRGQDLGAAFFFCKVASGRKLWQKSVPHYLRTSLHGISPGIRGSIGLAVEGNPAICERTRLKILNNYVIPATPIRSMSFVSRSYFPSSLLLGDVLVKEEAKTSSLQFAHSQPSSRNRLFLGTDNVDSDVLQYLV
ncbi:hypothetical protein B0H13DRAFT_1908444 [Mycena leptocephala]|nr:hypothetical protein B0H13DRAFT_1908444 [Mycena leptocephala]